MTRLKEWIWDKLFLDFYLDKRFTLKFKFVNLLYGDELRAMLAFLGIRLRSIDQACDEGTTDKWLAQDIHRAMRDMNDVWDLFLRPKHRSTK